jgi:hypothetical protein
MIDDFDEQAARCIQAIEALRLIRRAHGTGITSVAPSLNIIDALRLLHSGQGSYGGLCPPVADALHRGLFSREPEPTPSPE